MAKLKTPLRYPGGKSRAMKFLGEYFPDSIQGYVEPFLGGGSVAIWVTQQYPNAYMHVNDAYYPLYCFWKTLQEEGKAMAIRLEDIKRSIGDDEVAQRDMFAKAQQLMHDDRQDPFVVACSFYIANKCSFSGLVSSSFSPQAYHGNFTINSIRKLPDYQMLIAGWNITNLDYSYFMIGSTDMDFIFLDPPYDIKSFLYGKDGDKHKGFDHDEFKFHVDNLKTRFMITYNANPKLIDLYKTYYCLQWDLKYTMRSTGTYRQDQKDRKELLITNYER
jgi:site-specific DNA-adenine methylase